MNTYAQRNATFLVLLTMAGCSPYYGQRQGLASLFPPQAPPRPVYYQNGVCNGGEGMPASLRAAACESAVAEAQRAQADEQKSQQDTIDRAHANEVAAEKARATETVRKAAFESGEAQGYSQTDFMSLLLDGKQLADAQAKISFDGFYIKVGEVEYILQSQNDIMALVGGYSRVERKLPMLSEDASRPTRERLLHCRERWAIGQIAGGCRISIFGHMTTCRSTTLMNSSEIPCIAVEFSWTPGE
jgi:hypothetical protein